MRHWLERYVLPCMDGEGGGAGGGAGGAGDKDKDIPDWGKKLIETNEALSNTMKEMLDLGKRNRETLEQYQQRTGQQGGEEEEEEEEEPGASDADLETMNRAQYGQYIVSQVMKNIKDVIQPVAAKTETVASEVQVQRANDEVQKCVAKFDDFWEWQNEMFAIAKENPTLHVERLYKLARIENPEKAKTVDEKVTKAKEENEKKTAGEARGKQTPRKLSVKFGGMTPNGSGGETANKKMAPREAGMAAWDTLVAEMGEPDFQE